jgi:hypothetical protein
MDKNLKAGQLIARGVCRHLKQYNFECLEEFVPIRGSRVDIMAIGPKGELWIIECKSSLADYTQDTKWEKYLPFCDRYFWAVPNGFPIEILPKEDGLIIADSYEAEIIKMAPYRMMTASQRKKITLKIARNAANRLRKFIDPSINKRFNS